MYRTIVNIYYLSGNIFPASIHRLPQILVLVHNSSRSSSIANQMLSSCQFLRSQTFLRCVPKVLTAAKAAPVFRPTFRSFSTTLDSESLDLDQIREDAIAKLSSIMKFTADPESEFNITEDMIRHFMQTCAQKRNVPVEFIHTLLEASVAWHTTLPNVVPVIRYLVDNGETTEEGEPIVEFFSRLTVLGDMHGQYDDLAMIFETPEIGDYPSPYNQYLFNGDMVNRGPMSVETMTLILYCNLLLPNSVHILRGNHESRTLTKNFGFLAEVLRKYDKDTYDRFQAVFDVLPIAAVVEDEYFVVHGGLGTISGDLTIDEINQLDRRKEPEMGSVIMEMLWSG